MRPAVHRFFELLGFDFTPAYGQAPTAGIKICIAPSTLKTPEQLVL